MSKKVLIVDDDKVMISLINKKVKNYENDFIAITVHDGSEALEMLKKHTISLVVTDLQMPKMDGYVLLAHLVDHYPDIPVIIITAFGRPKTENVVKKSGAADYIEKPFAVEELAKKIIGALKKQSEGGSLHNASLEMFIQLIEMEQKTCTIRVSNKSNNKRGVFFFRDGDILNARLGEVQGSEAAYEIFSWNQVSFTIENDCALKESKIDEDLQAILLEAMRRKDEQSNQEADGDETDTDSATALDDIPEENRSVEENVLSVEEEIRAKIENEIGKSAGLNDIAQEDTYDTVIENMSKIAPYFNAGDFRAGFLINDDARAIGIKPNRQTIVLSLNPKCDRDRILHVLSEVNNP